MGSVTDRKARARVRRRRFETLSRLVLTFVLVVVTHGLLGGLAWIKLRRSSSSVSDSRDEGLRIWSMSESDPLLTVEARDFLSLNGLLLEELSPLRIVFPADGSVGVYTGGSFASWEREKERLGVRLSWERFTSVLDGHAVLRGGLPSFVSRSSEGLGISSGLVLERDLGECDLGTDWGIWRDQVSMNWRSEVTVSRPVSRLGSVRVSKYENRSWEVVSASSLCASASALLRSRPTGSGSLGQIWIDVFGSETGGSRVHLRRSSGLASLDELSLRWVLERHRHLGHHHTDGVVVSGLSHHIEYMIEYGEP